MADKRESINNSTVSVKVDAEEAITTLKAIQREAKKATQALRELSNWTEKETTLYVDGREVSKLVNREEMKKPGFSHLYCGDTN